MNQARKTVQYPGKFKMRHGCLTEPVFAYETWGELNADKDNAILLFTGLSPSAHAASSIEDPSTGWWEQMIGDGLPLDTSTHFLICVNSLGSCFGSTGPSSTNPDTGKVYHTDFPVLTLEDVAKAGHEVVKHLGISHLNTVIGASMGGMTALAYCIEFPEMTDRLVSISSAARSTPYSISLRSLQREMIRSDPAWKSGHYAKSKPPVDGMRLARKLGMLTYRSPDEFQQRFGRELISEEKKAGDPFGISFEVESYLDAHANKFIGTFDANSYLYLSRAMDLFDVADHGGSLQSGLNRVGATQVLVIGAESDILFPIEQQEELARYLDNGERSVEFVRLASIQGHDAFLVDMDRFRPVICDFFNCSLNSPGKGSKLRSV